MKRLFRYMLVLFTTGLLFLMPSAGSAQSPELNSGAPPVEQPLVTEGDFAVTLGTALGVIETTDPIEAETRLGELEIAPRNGWISDYPVTPDIIVELRNAVAKAADAGLLTLNRSEALIRMNDAAAEYGLAVRAYTEVMTYEPSPASCATYPNPVEVQNSYVAGGTPVVTYYCPPPAYYEMYAWVPSPFWWNDLWFPGFYVLHDFNRVIRHHNRTVVIRNHFNDVRQSRAFRIDPTDRFRGRTFRGIGAPRRQEFIPTGVPRGERVIFNPSRMIRIDGAGTVNNPSGGMERTTPVIRHESSPTMRQERRHAPLIHREAPAAPAIRQELRGAPGSGGGRGDGDGRSSRRGGSSGRDRRDR
jgi:hypothetical protein